MRAATCDWLVDNWEEMEPQLIPRTYPRVSKDDESQYHEPFFYTTLGLAAVALAAVIVAAALVFHMRNRRVIRHAQIEFLWLLLAGLLLVSLGALLSIMPPTNATCIITIWLTNLGYTLELVPLIVKVAAIQKIISATRQMKRVKLGRKHLFGVVFGLTFLVVVFLVIWTALDAPHKQSNYALSDMTTGQRETVVLMTHFCLSDSDIWQYLSALWHSLLLLTATVLAFQIRKLQTDFNETHTLALMIYSHFVFVCLRMITFSLEAGGNEADIARYRSLIYSSDVITTIVVYFCTKFISKNDSNLDGTNNPNSNHGASGSSPVANGRQNTTGVATNGSQNSASRGFGKAKGFIHSIMESPYESDSQEEEDGHDHEKCVLPGGVEQPKTPSSTEDDTEERLQAYFTQHMSGLRCRNCGQAYAR